MRNWRDRSPLERGEASSGCYCDACWEADERAGYFVTEREEQTAKALRRAWREFTDKVNRMGNVTLHTSVEEREHGDPPTFDFHAYTRITD